MILTLIFIGFVILGIILLIIYNKCDISFDAETNLEMGYLMCLITGLLGSVICISIIGITHSRTYESKAIYSNAMRRECIMKQIECINSDYEDVSKATVIENVYNWNKDVYKCSYYASNPWTSWFYNKNEIQALEYIDLNLIE